MKKFFVHTIIFAAIGGFFALPVLAGANAHAASFPYWGPILSCTGNNSEITQIPNGTDAKGNPIPRCTSICDIFATLQNILFFFLTVVLLIVVPLAFAVGAIVMITSAGSSERVASGQSIITSTVIGVLFVLASFLIVNTFFFVVTKFLISPTSKSKLPVKWYSISCRVSTSTSTP